MTQRYTHYPQEEGLAIFAQNTGRMNEQLYMQRCLQLAGYGDGHVSPNPMVGAVIVDGDLIIGEGYHKKAGGPHAEVEAIRCVGNEEQLRTSTLYVNLEPCSHFGRTPPCTSLILEKKIPKVVVGMKDPFERVNGSGIQLLRENGVEVSCGILESECRQLNRRFITFHEKKRPYVILKWAQTADGFIGTKKKKINISNSLSGIYTHKMRHTEDGILAGAGTIRTDNPKLNTRNWAGKSPVRVIIDPKGSLMGQSAYHVFDGTQRTLVITQQEESDYPNSEIIRLSPGLSIIPQLSRALYEAGLQSLLVEGGAGILGMFLENGIWDECHIFTSPHLLVGGVPAPGTPMGVRREIELQDNTLSIITNPAMDTNPPYSI